MSDRASVSALLAAATGRVFARLTTWSFNMHAAVLLVALAATGVDFGYEPAPEGTGYDYQIQLQPELIDALSRGQMIESEIPDWMQVRRFRISMGRQTLPKRRGANDPAPESGAMRAAFERVQRVGTTDPQRFAPNVGTDERRGSAGRPASDRTSRRPAAPRNTFGDAVTPGAKGDESLAAAAPTESFDRSSRVRESSRDLENDAASLLDESDRTASGYRRDDELRTTTVAKTPRSSRFDDEEDDSRRTSRTKAAADDDEVRPRPEVAKKSSPPASRDREESTDSRRSAAARSEPVERAGDGAPSGGALALATLLLMLSIGANVYLGWVVSTQRLRFWDLVDRFRATKRDQDDLDVPLPPRPRPLLARPMMARRRFDAANAGLADDATV